ncbi:thioredoxin-disulfide reductase [Elusimicrobiota bacterium]
MIQANKYDLIIIGGGPAGLTAGLYASRAKLKTLLLEKMGCGGQVMITDRIENYPGFPDGLSGFELSAKIEEQAKKFGLEVKLEAVKSIQVNDLKTVITDSTKYAASAVIIATGANYRRAGVPGENELIGKGVSYCATCDAAFFKEKDVVVIGGGDSAIQEALFLTKFAKKVKIVHRRDQLRATKILQDRVLANDKIEVLWGSIVTKILGQEKVSGVELKNVKSGKVSSINTDGVFVFIGFVPNTSFVEDILKLTETKHITTDSNMQTPIEGLYACGDVRDKLLKQVVTAAGDGATAAFAAQQYLDKKKESI